MQPDSKRAYSRRQFDFSYRAGNASIRGHIPVPNGLASSSNCQDSTHPARNRRWASTSEEYFASSQVIIINNLAYVIDCGNGIAIQLARAGVPLPALRHVFITHHHSDHNADYGNLLLLSWASELQNGGDAMGATTSG